MQSLMSFHPLVSIANAFVNHEREIVCDEAVLQYGRVHSGWVKTTLGVLSLARGRSMFTGGLVGVFERGDRIQNRLESIMQFETNRKRSRLTHSHDRGGVCKACLPMAPWVSADLGPRMKNHRPGQNLAKSLLKRRSPMTERKRKKQHRILKLSKPLRRLVQQKEPDPKLTQKSASRFRLRYE